MTSVCQSETGHHWHTQLLMDCGCRAAERSWNSLFYLTETTRSCLHSPRGGWAGWGSGVGALRRSPSERFWAPRCNRPFQKRRSRCLPWPPWPPLLHLSPDERGSRRTCRRPGRSSGCCRCPGCWRRGRWSGCQSPGRRWAVPAELKPGSPRGKRQVSSARRSTGSCWRLHREGHLCSGSLQGRKTGQWREEIKSSCLILSSAPVLSQRLFQDRKEQSTVPVTDNFLVLAFKLSNTLENSILQNIYSRRLHN